MIRRADIADIRKCMNELGYIEGEYDKRTNELKPVAKEKSMLWKTKMNNLLPFKKVNDCEYAKLTEFDFSFSLDLDLNLEPVERMVEASEPMSESPFQALKPAHFFIHQCCHHYKEATNASWVILDNDINLIKFCDVREFVLQIMTTDDLQEAIDFAKIYGIQKAVYFTLFYLNLIYTDGYEEEMLNQLSIDDNEFLNYFGEKDFGYSLKWSKSFWDRMFSDSNKDEITETPKYSGLVDFV
ncbi:hypothetical protein D3C76_509500 [compost metagenome]